MRSPALTFRPLTPARWRDLEKLFGARGACGGCWCMWWRLRRTEWQKNRGAGNRRAFRRIVARGEAPGVLAYAGGAPVGWCAIAPRRAYPVLARSPILKPVDDAPVWAITCLFVPRPYRRRGVSARLLDAAAAFARRRGARIVEGYPTEPRGAAIPDVHVFTGLRSAFDRAGFAEVARRSPTRPIMRRAVYGRR
jgi:GNAT superfamily N-acetyltransferase